ncbi:MAG: hypothetical protein B6D41_01720 [Chloroflexi bacterium UTCFX4]|jgi:serine/threonine-protein kinase|nr:MAG: hypothetical protein B6D41_01720 [Chloroflexi bacterium UTCFX4]
MNCKWCNSQNRDTARFCATCRAPTVDGVQIENLRSGQRLSGRYEVRKALGVGAMGAVYGALDGNIANKRVAIKEYSPARNTNPAEQKIGAEMFEEEAQMLVRLDHPNMPKISDYFREGMNQYMVMDFIDGVTLEEYLQQYHRVPEAQVMGWGQQIASALHYLHSQDPPIIFRDMKPGNVMLDKQGRIKLIDFGIARKFKPGKAQDTQKFGTPGFAPPEAYGKGQTDARSDVYSLAVTMYVLASGHDPSNDPFNLPPLRSILPNVSPTFERVVESGRQLQAQQRWQTMELFTTALSGAQGGPTYPAGPIYSGPIQVGAPPFAGSGGATKTRSLTQSLAESSARLSNSKLVALLSGIALVSLTLVAFFARAIAQANPRFDIQYPLLATIGVLAYVATRRVWTPLATFTPLAIAAFWVSSMSLGGLDQLQVSIQVVIFSAFITGLIMMGWAYLQPNFVGKGEPRYYSVAQSHLDTIWCVLMGFIATVIFTIGAHSSSLAPWAEPTMYVFGALNGLVGWFVGDYLYRLTQEKKDQRGS